jgi:hypothetical protein
LDAPEPPQIVVEQPAPCVDSHEAQAALEHALAPTKAPAGGWTVHVRFTHAQSSYRAQAEISDEVGAPAGHRAMDGHDCTSLAEAIGVWAALVLDAEAERSAHHATPAPAPPPLEPPAPPPEKPSPEAALFLAHPPEERQLEVGLAGFVMAGTGTGMVGGGSLFAVSEVGAGWFLRPGLGLGRTFTEILPTVNAEAAVGDARFDACKRIPGNYLDRRGIQIDLCGGADVGFIHVLSAPATATSPAMPSGTFPLFALGPSLDLRGELGSELSALVRVVGEWNVLRETSSEPSVTPALLIGRAEVGLSWRLR